MTIRKRNWINSFNSLLSIPIPIPFIQFLSIPIPGIGIGINSNSNSRIDPSPGSSISWRDHWSLSSLDSVIGTGFYKLLSVSDILYTPHMPKFYMPTFGNHRNNSKTVPISIYLIQIPTANSPGCIYTSAIFSAVNPSCVTTHGIPSLFHILSSFVHVGHISMPQAPTCLQLSNYIRNAHTMHACAARYIVPSHGISKHRRSAETRANYEIITEYWCITMGIDIHFIWIKTLQQCLLHVTPHNSSEILDWNIGPYLHLLSPTLHGKLEGWSVVK